MLAFNAPFELIELYPSPAIFIAREGGRAFFQRGSLQLMDARYAHIEDGRDFREIQFFDEIELDHQLVPLCQRAAAIAQS